jgi:hypothetical protein
MSSKKRMNPAMKMAARVNTNLAPYSQAISPPANPPPVNLHPKRHIVVDIEVAAVVGGAYNLDVLGLKQALAAQLSSATTPLNFTVEYIHVWGAVTPTGSASLTLQDSIFGTAMSGDNSSTHRPRAGIRYPKNIQPFIGPNSTTTFSIAVVKGVVPATGPLTFRIGMTYWQV